MKSCLFLTEDWPLSPDAPGGAGPLCYAHLELLAHAGCQVWLVILVDARSPKGFQRFTQEQPEVWARVQSWCHQVMTLPVEHQPVERGLIQRLQRAIGVMQQPFFVPATSMAAALVEQGIAASPHIIWAEHLLPASIAARVFAPNDVIYSHHDWHWRIKSHRSANRDWRYRMRMAQRRRQEEALVRAVKACVTPSATEGAELERLSGRPVGYFPTTYSPVAVAPELPPSPPRLVHLGGMRTTANRLGLQRFLEVAWPRITARYKTPPELWVVGTLSGAPDTLRQRLEEVGAVCPGFVPDLTTVLRPNDIHIVPWEHDTGTRTRIPLALNYGQVVVATRAAAACLPELRHGENALLTDDLDQMADEIIGLLTDDERRRRLARAGRQTFLTAFTREAVQPRFDRFLSHLLPEFGYGG